MANRRMLHKSISCNKRINSLSEFAQLLFSWIIPHLDDFGKIDGDPEVIKALVMPMNPRSVNEFEEAICEIIKKVKSVERYEVEERSILRYTSFEEHQSGLEKRTQSKYPDNPTSKNFSEKTRTSEVTETNRKEFNKSEENLREVNLTEEPFAEDQIGEKQEIKDPSEFLVIDERGESMVCAWEELEPTNKLAFWSTYVRAYLKKLPVSKFREFVSEIKQDPSIKNPGAVFNKKVDEYFKSERMFG